MDIQRIREQHKLDAVVLFGTEEILAATGIYAPESGLVAQEQGVVLIEPESQKDETKSVQEPKEVPLERIFYAECGFEQVEYGKENLLRAVQNKIAGKKRTGYNRYTCPAALSEESCIRAGKDLSVPIREAMLCKSPWFFQKYAKVKEWNIMAYNNIRKEIRPGNTEQELCRLVRETYLSQADGQVFYTGDFLSGERTSEVAGAATERAICSGDTVIVDALCSYEGVHCDTTRTYFCGDPTKEQEKAYAVLCSLQDEIRQLLYPGTVAGDVYRYADRRLREEGYGGLPHHAGHGLGYSWYEEPFFIRNCETVLKENMLVAVEPGIYISGKFGMRLENNYRITQNGGEDVFCCKQNIEDFILR